jgi:saccharopine dehydrogenase-like NADP-dependent oxidoreductase
MYQVAVFGAGKIGEAIALLLLESGDYEVRLCDIDAKRAETVAATFKNPRIKGLRADPADSAQTIKALTGCHAVISALPFYCNKDLAQAAFQTNIHYFDLTEDVATTEAVNQIAKKAQGSFMPQCGLAPGFISIAATSVMQSFDEIEELKLRVGALPLYPSNALRYNLTWSTDGLINEYGNPCEALVDGKDVLVQPLEGYETFYLEGQQYEAFNTSGGLGSMRETFRGKLKNLTYKTIRYVGHRDLIYFLMHDLKFNHDRETLKKIFERSIPGTTQDKCVIFVEARGKQDGHYQQQSYATTIKACQISGKTVTAIQLTTACGILAPLDLILTNAIKPRAGVMRIEEIGIDRFLSNRFGRHYMHL